VSIEDIFHKMDSSGLQVAESYTMKWGNGVEDPIVVKILPHRKTIALHEEALLIPE
jgi:hypothetical protein